jgi:hypothetical protein
MGSKTSFEILLVPGPRPSPTELRGIGLAKLPAPLATRLVGDNASAFQEYGAKLHRDTKFHNFIYLLDFAAIAFCITLAIAWKI